MKYLLIFLIVLDVSHLAIASKNDSILNNEVNQLIIKVSEIEKENIILKSDVGKVDELNKTRFTDLYIWIGIFIALLTGVFVLVTINANSVARKQAIEELEKLSKMIEDLGTKAVRVEAQLNEAETKLQVFESLKNRENE
jgi:hypothetical protein